MKIQSLSVVVPNRGCINNCKFCVSKMRAEEYKNQINSNLPFFDLYYKDYKKRLEFARDNGCNTVMLTGNSEPQQNRTFLEFFGTMNSQLAQPFRNIEMQTTGRRLDDGYLCFLRNHVGISTISLSISSFDKEQNAQIINDGVEIIEIPWLCQEIKKYDFNLRLSLNMLHGFEKYTPEQLFGLCKELGADQVTFRVMYQSGNATPQDIWLEENVCDPLYILRLGQYVLANGRFLETMEFGAKRYSVNGMSTVIDNDCMSGEAKEALKYLILRENCKLYSKWDDEGSLVF